MISHHPSKIFEKSPEGKISSISSGREGIRPTGQAQATLTGQVQATPIGQTQAI